MSILLVEFNPVERADQSRVISVQAAGTKQVDSRRDVAHDVRIERKRPPHHIGTGLGSDPVVHRWVALETGADCLEVVDEALLLGAVARFAFRKEALQPGRLETPVDEKTGG